MVRETKLPQLVQMRLSDDLAKGIDDWRRKEEDIPSRSEAMRRLIQKGFGYDRPEAGVTPDMVMQAVRALWAAIRRDDPDVLTFEEQMPFWRQKKGLSQWRDNFIDIGRLEDDEDTRAWLGEDADLVLKVAAVLRHAVAPSAA